MNRIRKQLAFLVVTMFTCQAIVPELALANGNQESVQEEEDTDDTEEEEEEATTQSTVPSAKPFYLDPTYIVPVVIGVVTVVYFANRVLRGQAPDARALALGVGGGGNAALNALRNAPATPPPPPQNHAQPPAPGGSGFKVGRGGPRDSLAGREDSPLIRPQQQSGSKTVIGSANRRSPRLNTPAVEQQENAVVVQFAEETHTFVTPDAQSAVRRRKPTPFSRQNGAGQEQEEEARAPVPREVTPVTRTRRNTPATGRIATPMPQGEVAPEPVMVLLPAVVEVALGQGQVLADEQRAQELAEIQDALEEQQKAAMREAAAAVEPSTKKKRAPRKTELEKLGVAPVARAQVPQTEGRPKRAAATAKKPAQTEVKKRAPKGTVTKGKKRVEMEDPSEQVDDDENDARKLLKFFEDEGQ